MFFRGHQTTALKKKTMPKDETYKRTEDGKVYEYSTSIAKDYAAFARFRLRQKNQDNSFKAFYDQLLDYKKERITITNKTQIC